MPVRSLRSSVLKWPDRETVHRAVVEWTRQILSGRPDIVRVGYFGSYARGNWGMGSDLDMIVVVAAPDAPFGERSLGQDVLDLPVGVDLLIYTSDEWQALPARDGRFYREVIDEAVWVYPGDHQHPLRELAKEEA